MKHHKNLHILLPDSLLEDSSDQLMKTIKLGVIARAAAIFNVNQIGIYRSGSKGARKEAYFIKNILEYLDCPQYLRKIMFPIQESLKSVGVLPPIEAPHHEKYLDVKSIKKGMVRQGVVVKKDNKYSYLQVGLDRLVKVENPALPNKRRLNVKIIKTGRELIGKITEDPDVYWGFKTVIYNKNLIDALKEVSAELVIGTSKYGVPITKITRQLALDIHEKTSIAVVFGSPFRGIYQIVKDKNLLSKSFDYVVNFAPNQGTKTIRTEEAVILSLGILNYLILSG